MRHVPSTPLFPHLPSGLAARAKRRPPTLVATLLVVLVLPGTAAAWEPGVAAAIAWTGGSRTAAALPRMQAAEDALAEATRGVSARFVAEPEVGYGADVEDPARISGSLALELDVAWEHDAVTVLSAQIALAEAQLALRNARRADTKEAFELHVARVRAELARAEADADLAEARADHAAAQAGGDAMEQAYAELELRSVELDVADAAAELAAAEDAVRSAALQPWPEFQAVLFALAPVTVARAPAHQVLALEVARAESVLARERAFGVVQDLGLSARYESRTDHYQLDASLGIDDGRPVAAVGAAYRPQQDDQWSVTLGARIVIDASTLRAATEAETAVAEARAELEAFEASLERSSADAVRRARAAEERLLIAWRTWRTREAEVAALADGGGDVTRPEAALRRDRDRLLLAWLRYVEEVDDYLALVGGEWQVEGRAE